MADPTAQQLGEFFRRGSDGVFAVEAGQGGDGNYQAPSIGQRFIDDTFWWDEDWRWDTW